MILLRLLVIAFNVGIIGFLIYRMIGITQKPYVDRTQKVVFLVGGVLLLIAPLGMFLRFFGPSPQYFLIYPLAIFMFLYLTKQL
jgi:hypothetical protein